MNTSPFKRDYITIVSGLPRSGTSMLCALLALDPNARAPLAWEGLHPLPWDGATEAARRTMAECEQEFWADVQPEFAAIHELRSDLPVECVTLTLPGFSGGHWEMIANIPNWSSDYEATISGAGLARFARQFTARVMEGRKSVKTITTLTGLIVH